MSGADAIFSSKPGVLIRDHLHFSSRRRPGCQNLKVSLFDCNAVTVNTLFAVNQVRQAHITPEELEIIRTKLILYTKHFRKELNKTNCRI